MSAPSLSACVILLAPGVSDDTDEAPLWLGRRAQHHTFLGGFHAFIGGHLDPEDLADDGELEALRRCAARELYEELGVVFLQESGIWFEQSLEDIAWHQRLALLGDHLDASRYLEVGRWSSPEWAPKRYETEFFLVVLTEDEAVALRAHPAEAMLERAGLEVPAWRTPEQWLRLHEYGDVLLSVPTLELILELREHTPRLLADAATRLSWRHDASAIAHDPMRRFAHTAHTWMVPLESPTLLPATHTNCYVVGDQERFVVIDPGADSSETLAPLCELLDALFARGARCEAIILTHHHTDHVSGVAWLAEHYGEQWPVWAHALTTPLLSERDVPQGVARELVDGELFELGAAHTLEVLWTPGHAPGHIALMHRESRLVFCGDLVASQGSILVAPPRGHMGDYLASLHRVQQLAPSSLHPAHGWPVRDAHAHLAHYIAHRQQRERSVLDALRERPGEQLTALDIVPIVYQDVPKDVWPLAAMSLEAHLIHLSTEHPQVTHVVEDEQHFPGHYVFDEIG